MQRFIVILAKHGEKVNKVAKSIPENDDANKIAVGSFLLGAFIVIYSLINLKKMIKGHAFNPSPISYILVGAIAIVFSIWLRSQ